MTPNPSVVYLGLDVAKLTLACNLAGIPTREVCDWHRFHNRRQVSSYTGLCPREYSSGGKRVTGSVTKHGNPRLRAALVELGWRMVRLPLRRLRRVRSALYGEALSRHAFQPGYPPVAKRLHILGKGAKATGAQRKKMSAAVARQLAVALCRLNTGRCTAAQLGLRVTGGAPAQAPEEVADSGGNSPATSPRGSSLTNVQHPTSNNQSPVTSY